MYQGKLDPPAKSFFSNSAVLTSLFNTYILRYRKARTVLIPKVEGISSEDQLRQIKGVYSKRFLKLNASSILGTFRKHLI